MMLPPRIHDDTGLRAIAGSRPRHQICLCLSACREGDTEHGGGEAAVSDGYAFPPKIALRRRPEGCVRVARTIFRSTNAMDRLGGRGAGAKPMLFIIHVLVDLLDRWPAAASVVQEPLVRGTNQWGSLTAGKVSNSILYSSLSRRSTFRM
jgi:hypothetical protein